MLQAGYTTVDVTRGPSQHRPLQRVNACVLNAYITCTDHWSGNSSSLTIDFQTLAVAAVPVEIQLQ